MSASPFDRPAAATAEPVNEPTRCPQKSPRLLHFFYRRSGGLLAILISAEPVQWKEPTMFPAIPAAAEPLVAAIGVAFTEPSLRRFCVLMCGLIVTIGRRTVSHALAVVRPELEGHWSNYHRL